MCGIFAILNKSKIKDTISINTAIQSGKIRGPEQTQYTEIGSEIVLAFHRLAINGIHTSSMQPLVIDDCTLICNGEIFNFKKLHELVGIPLQSGSDCEIIIHLYLKYGMRRTLQMLDGEFAFVLLDTNLSRCPKGDVLYIARDPFGIRPLYISKGNQDEVVIASELKNISHITKESQPNYWNVHQVNPGSFTSFGKSTEVFSMWLPLVVDDRYYTIPYGGTSMNLADDFDILNISQRLVNVLSKAVEKRVSGTLERPLACLLSGGLDSSLIAALTAKFYTGELHTYSIGMPGSKDLLYAKMVAKHINSVHHEVVLTPEDFFEAIPEVISKIDSFDTTTVRASVGNYLIGKYIKEHSNQKVVLNGDGSDELTGGYIYLNHAPDNIEFDVECRRLLENIHYFDVLRSDRSISTNGLEPRTPFLDTDVVSYYMGLPAELRNPKSRFNMENDRWDVLADTLSSQGQPFVSNIIRSRPEKLLLRYAFYMCIPNLLPNEILWRSKEAFSDGVSGDNGSWFKIITDKLNDINIPSNTKENVTHMIPNTKEQLYYRSIFDALYPNCETTIPYFWMPKYIDVTDPSARLMNDYTER